MNSKGPLSILLLLTAIVIAAGRTLAQTPEVLKVEPPSWWVGSSVNPIGVLMRGGTFRGGRVHPNGDGIRVLGEPKANKNGTYLFVTVSRAANTSPGERRLRIMTAGGSAEARFQI